MVDKDQAEKQKAERDEPVSLAPADPTEALKALLATKPLPDPISDEKEAR